MSKEMKELIKIAFFVAHCCHLILSVLCATTFSVTMSL